jgi:uncharacterized protein DUF6338
MAGFVIDATQAGEVITYVAPGFLAQLGYRARYPAPERSAGQVLIISVVISLPLVALADWLVSGSHKPTRLGYVALLTAGAFALGYLLALLRGRKFSRWALAWLDYRIEPEGTIYAQTLKHMSPAAPVLIELKDGRRVSGTPRNGPESPNDGINELYLTHPEAQDKDGSWYSSAPTSSCRSGRYRRSCSPRTLPAPRRHPQLPGRLPGDAASDQTEPTASGEAAPRLAQEDAAERLPAAAPAAIPDPSPADGRARRGRCATRPWPCTARAGSTAIPDCT